MGPTPSAPRPHPFTLLHSSPIENMVDYLTVAQQNIDAIERLTKRVETLEEQARIGSTGKRAASSGPSRAIDPAARVDSLVKKSLDMENERMAILAFNKDNQERDPQDMLKWHDTTVLKGGKERKLTFTRADDNLSLTRLIQSDHREILCNSGPVYTNITANIFKKYWVVIINGELVPLCRDFKGGIGREYFWSTDEEMLTMPPSEDWKNASKLKNDPRRKFIDPKTMRLWVPDSERLDVVSEPANDSNEDIHDGSSDGKGSGDEEVDEKEVGNEEVNDKEVDDEGGEDEKGEVDKGEVEKGADEKADVKLTSEEEEEGEEEEEEEEEEESLRMEKKMRHG